MRAASSRAGSPSCGRGSTNPERALVGYAAREGIINIPATQSGGGTAAGGITGERPLVADDLAALNIELRTRASAQRIQAQSRLQRRAPVAEQLTNDAVTGLRQPPRRAAAEYARLMIQFEPDYPQAVAVRQQIDQLDQTIAREEARVRSALRGTYQFERRRANRSWPAASTS